jgi:hypothetical protein
VLLLFFDHLVKKRALDKRIFTREANFYLCQTCAGCMI